MQGYDQDQLAAHLIRMSCLGREMSPGWDGARVKHRVAGLDGEAVGWILPGKGLYVDTDLKKLGITKQLPFVYEYSPFMKLRDRVARTVHELAASEVGAITTYDGIISGRAGGKADDTVATRNSITTAAGFWYDTWKAAGGTGAGVPLTTTPPTDQKLDRSTAGALSLGLSNPGGSDKKYLVSLGAVFGSAHNFAMLIDRLLDAGSFTLTAATSTITTPKTIDRNYSAGALGVGCQVIATVSTARATPGAGTWQLVNYVDDTGASVSGVANALPATADPVDRLIAHQNTANPFMQLIAGGIGVKSLKSTTRAAAGDTTGVAGLAIVYPLMFIPALGTASVYIERDLPSDLSGLVELANLSQVIGALSMLVYANAATLGALTVFMRTVAG